MPSMTTRTENDSSLGAAVEKELSRLVGVLVNKELTGDDLYVAFQEIDPRAKGYISSTR